MNRLKTVMLLLIANEARLGPEWKDHPLKEARADYRESLVGGVFLLVYRIGDSGDPVGTVYLARTGTHSALFK